MRQSIDPLQTAHAEYGDAQFTPARRPSAAPIDMHKVLRSGNVPRGTNGQALKGSLIDVARWLPFAAEAYHISHDLNDYILVPTTIFHTDIPNANLCAFPFEEMSAWNTDAGCITFQSWRAKPTHVEHANSDPTQARGVIFDASMRPAPEFAGGLYRVVLLTGWDRNKDPERASIVATGRSGQSMGSWVTAYCCSACGADINRANGGLGCEHIHPKAGPRMREVANKDGTRSPVYRIARGVRGFECSSVATPAYRYAMSEAIG